MNSLKKAEILKLIAQEKNFLKISYMWFICKYFEITATITALFCKSTQAYVILLSTQGWGGNGLSAGEVGAATSPAGR